MLVVLVLFELAEPHRKLIDRHLDFLQAENIELFFVEKFLNLRIARADPVDVPSRNLHSAHLDVRCDRITSQRKKNGQDGMAGLALNARDENRT